VSDWVTYISQEEIANAGKCYEHRRRHGLSTARLDEIECDTECAVQGTCPFHADWVTLTITIEEIEDYEQRMRDLFPPEE